MDPLTISALIGLGSKLIGGQMDKNAAEEQAPIDMLNSLNPGQHLQGMETGFAIPGMQPAQSSGQRLLGGF